LQLFTPDLHLIYARFIRRQREGLSPAFMGDEELAYSKDWKLSTSNISVAWNDGFTFGPVTEHCYGARDFLFVCSRSHRAWFELRFWAAGGDWLRMIKATAIH
jgi:hypothetical protein